VTRSNGPCQRRNLRGDGVAEDLLVQIETVLETGTRSDAVPPDGSSLVFNDLSDSRTFEKTYY
jgi:hypothetical protein